MNRDQRLQALSEFLTTHRARLQPQSAGLPSGGRRRTPGLRREEVAQIAGVSTTWYTWLEQGRDIKMSAQVLDRIAFALQFNEEERKYLLLVGWDTLEDHTIGFRGSEKYQEWKRLLHHFYDPFPTVEHFRRIYPS